MSEINEADFNVWKAKAISRGKLLERFRDTVHNITDTVCDEADRVYFASTNQADELRKIAQEMEMWKWGRIIKERPEADPYADLRRLRREAEANQALIRDLVEALKDAQAGLDYIQHNYGSLSGVGFERCKVNSAAALSRAREAGFGGGNV